MAHRLHALSFSLLVAACASRPHTHAADAAPASQPNQITNAASSLPADAAPTPGAAEAPSAPIKPDDILEGSAAESAIAAAALADRDAGSAPASQPDAPTGLRSDGVGAFILGMPSAEVARLAAPALLVRQPSAPGSPRIDDAILRSAAGPWLRLRVYAGRLTEIHVLARDGRALTDEGIGPGSTLDEAELAHGDARPVTDETTGKLRGYVLADLPGILWVPSAAPPAAAPDGGPSSPRLIRAVVLGPEALAPAD